MVDPSLAGEAYTILNAWLAITRPLIVYPAGVVHPDVRVATCRAVRIPRRALTVVVHATHQTEPVLHFARVVGRTKHAQVNIVDIHLSIQCNANANTNLDLHVFSEAT